METPGSGKATQVVSSAQATSGVAGLLLPPLHFAKLQLQATPFITLAKQQETRGKQNFEESIRHISSLLAVKFT